MSRTRRPLLLALALAAALAPAASAAAAPTVVRDGNARFEVITPTLVRVQLAADGRFEAGRTQLTADGLAVRAPKVRVTRTAAELVLRTSRATIRWRRGATDLAAGTLRARVDGRLLRPHTGTDPQSLGGWRRSLDITDGPVPLHPGVLSRSGWAVIDDTQSALTDGDTARPRPSRTGAYLDAYVFLAGAKPVRALQDLRVLTGPSPLLPRKAFGVWFSKWYPYGANDVSTLLARFREEQVPLDTLSLDTDFKRVNEPAGAAVGAQTVGHTGLPYSWNGWDWNKDLFPDPAAFVNAAHDAGVALALNVHPSIDSRDPRFARTQATAEGRLQASDSCRLVQADLQGGSCEVFDWADPDQLKAYFDLHAPFERDGIDLWWLDWCCDASSAGVAGLTPDTFINRAYARRQRARGSRWPAFSRIGGSYQAGFAARVGNSALADHASTIQFTGDTCGGFAQLAFAAEYTAATAAIAQNYVSHDIGSFHSVSPTGVCDSQLSPLLTPTDNSLPDDLYVRWVQLGVFQPLERLHSHHGKRLPWEYGEPARTIAADALRLREALNPYLYTTARAAHDTGVPMVRPLYLAWPTLDAAYEHPTQYLLGPDLLVAPAVTAGSTVTQSTWFPPGEWTDLQTGERHRGPGVERLQVPLSRIPVFVRAGATLTRQPAVATTPTAPPRTVLLTAARGTGTSTLYDDDGVSLADAGRRPTLTRIRQTRTGTRTRLTIVPPVRRSAALPARRTWTVALVGYAAPRRVTVDGRTVRAGYDPATKTVTVTAAARSTARPVRIDVDAAGA